MLNGLDQDSTRIRLGLDLVQEMQIGVGYTRELQDGFIRGEPYR
jgi:hypothetical protein